jgi:hypothetical protein
MRHQLEKITADNSCKVARLKVSARLIAARACGRYRKAFDVIELIFD